MLSPSLPAESRISSENHIDTLRARYQKGLLAWLQAPESGAGLAAMTAALAELPQPHPLWQGALFLLQTIALGDLPPRVEYRRLAGRVDQALRKLAKGQSPDDEDLLRELKEPLAQLDPPPQPPMEALVPRSPLAATLEVAAAVLPLMAQSREPRFTTEQRKSWDGAVHALECAWEQRRESWQPLRKAIFRLLEGALPLNHPGCLRLAEALASATDNLEHEIPSSPLLAALTTSVELLGERDFLEHEALDERIEQLVARLGNLDHGPRSRTLDALFAREAEEEIEHMHQALDRVPPDVEDLAEAAKRLQRLAEPLDLPLLALAAFRFADRVALMEPLLLDHAPGRDLALAWVAEMQAWIQAVGEGEVLGAPAELAALQRQLQALE